MSKMPYKVLDAPALRDDFYLNLVDWSSQNQVAVGLSSCAYLWNAANCKVAKLCDMGETDGVSAVGWAKRGDKIAVGTKSGGVQLWDVTKMKLLRTFKGHTARVGTLAWNTQLLASGSRDRGVYLHDPRCGDNDVVMKLLGHKQEVCGLKWSPDEALLASGGNDNKLLIWDARQGHSAHSSQVAALSSSLSLSATGTPSPPLLRLCDHQAAVKAIAWSPHQSGLLASGGGTADRCIRFWNSLTGAQLSSVDTGSQVCNLLWSANANELVSTHGYSLNQIIVWRYPAMQALATLSGHAMRVLYLASSPDGQNIVTGAGDETLRFWQIFPPKKAEKKQKASDHIEQKFGNMQLTVR